MAKFRSLFFGVDSPNVIRGSLPTKKCEQLA